MANRRVAHTKDTVFGHHLSKKGNMQQRLNYRTISLIIHPSNVMLKILLNRLKPQAENIIAEQQAGFQTRTQHNRANLQPSPTVRQRHLIKHQPHQSHRAPLLQSHQSSPPQKIGKWFGEVGVR